ncbi:sigma 54-interacting transcriptional regulator [Pelotomaculum isophthalicicum JI]|uniref:HTH-type transcriptional regulatory protein TyrR n=1 Tax=Pelotomaculum isophthalicicum JI TaxID=947010 RepID=A0A9X4JV72_9FIRM|nr:sigma-54-dependent Fis family transcriptional regulator [Pelotomaculum isophthalicicum]MDF9406882.1 sigma 54-interacting transcriptional regulator [Pelotomaculum isophthalicicum JI]
MLANLIKKPPLTLCPDQTIGDVLRLWQEHPIGVVGIVDEQGRLLGVVGSGLTFRDGTPISLDTKLAEVMDKNFISMSPDVYQEEAWTAPSEVIAIVDADGKLQGISTKYDLATSLYPYTKFISRELDAVLNAAHTGIISINKDGIITTFNPAAEMITRRARNEAIGKFLTDVVIPTGLLEILETGETKFGQRLPVKYSVGTRIYVSNRSPIIEDGKVIGAVGIFQDISEIEFISHELESVKELNKELKALIESSYDGILIARRDGVVSQVNEAYTRMTGLRAKDIVGRPFQKLVEGGHYASSIVDAVLKKKKAVTNLQTSPMGNRLLITGNPVANERGEIVRVVINVRDLTEFEKLRQELHDSKNLNRRYQAELSTRNDQRNKEQDLTSSSPEMQSVIDLCTRVAQVDSTVLLIGDSGVGKEVLAKHIHSQSARKQGPFIKINCGAIPETLLESELFGYERGAFTGAGKDGKPGIFEMAHNGTLLLDEIGDLPLSLQVKLLRVLQDKEIIRVGGTKTRSVDVRILAATNRNLADMVQQGSFREDLFFRLNVVPVQIPPLRDRRSDIVPLLNFFCEKYYKKYGIRKQFSPEVLKIFYEYHWPGNIRELENIVERMVVTEPETVITPKHLPESLRYVMNNTSAKVMVQGVLPFKEALLEMESQLINEALNLYGSTYKAAKVLGIDQSTVIRKLQKIKQFKNNRQEQANSFSVIK